MGEYRIEVVDMGLTSEALAWVVIDREGLRWGQAWSKEEAERLARNLEAGDARRRIADLTLEDISSDGSGSEADVEAFKAACRNYRQANGGSEAEAITVIFGEGDFWERVFFWAPEEAERANGQGGA